MARVLVAMSGGVDSAVAAARALDAGHQVTGVHLKLADLPFHEQLPGQGCCTLDDAQDARRTAQVLGIDFYVWDLREVFEREVQTPFAEDYAAGVTPNPCARCNERVKYAALLDRALRLGFDALATGHHARVEDGRLLRGRDPRKDQSYVLYMATPKQLAHTLLPIGELTKDQVREKAERLGLRVADKRDSYDVCFIPDGDTAGYLAGHLPTVRGEIVDVDGTVLGEHEGIWRYTVGQRRGLGLDHHERRFVVDLDASSNRVVVGPREALACRWVEVDAPTWTRQEPADGERVELQVRAHGRPVPARIRAGTGRLTVDIEEPLHGVAEGQAAVLYRGAECLGGGTITRADRAAAGAAVASTVAGS